MRTFFAMVAFVATFTFVWAVEAAQCGKNADVTSVLTNKYKEQLRAVGMVGERGFMQFFASEDGSWTVLMPNTDGIACIIAAGDDYETRNLKPELPPTF